MNCKVRDCICIYKIKRTLREAIIVELKKGSAKATTL